jgi:magnesium-transporting ATPase (P-type)
VETGKIFVFCKGADQSIISRCKVKDQTVEKSVEEFADKGYRTLTFGYRVL